ncbi:hypothetical protein [Streptomyces niveus]|uniref:hypothetical protein n=1 Tax=Streptomyces niveus TaxID=193462 RepID=UPI003662A27E
MSVVQELESQEEKAWNSYLDHARDCSTCGTPYTYCKDADELLSKVQVLRDAIGWRPH